MSEKKGGRKKASVAQPDLLPSLEAAIACDTAGSPVDQNLRWTNRSPADLTTQLNRQGFRISVDTLRKILFDVLGLSRRQAFKDDAACHFPQRDEQFQYIAKLRDEYQRHGWTWWLWGAFAVSKQERENTTKFYVMAFWCSFVAATLVFLLTL